MPRGKKELAEQIIPYAASVEVEVGRGKTVAESVKKIGVASDSTPYLAASRWASVVAASSCCPASVSVVGAAGAAANSCRRPPAITAKAPASPN